MLLFLYIAHCIYRNCSIFIINQSFMYGFPLPIDDLAVHGLRGNTRSYDLWFQRKVPQATWAKIWAF